MLEKMGAENVNITNVSEIRYSSVALYFIGVNMENFETPIK